MSLSLYDTRRRAVVPFSSIDPGRVRMYNCGPTVYSTAHVGNFRSFLLADLLRRHFEASGYEVLQVMNITDVGHLTEDDRADAGGEDKLLATASALGWDPFRVARHFEDLFHIDRRRLGLRDAHHYPRATEHVAEMLQMIQTLLDRGHAYVAAGEVYFDVSSFPAYGSLSGRRLEDQRAGARVAVNPKKQSPEDFALWKRDDGHLMQFDPSDPALWAGRHRGVLHPEIGRGFPGWHIECSAMARRYLGDTFDVHTGGEDNLFPHHECEVAQSVGATGQPLAHWWLHTRHLQVDGEKMSKSGGTAYSIDDLVEKGFSPSDIRYALISHHYRRPMNLTDEGLQAAQSAVARIHRTHDGLRRSAGLVPEPLESAASLTRDFMSAMDDDLDVPAALVAVHTTIADWNRRELSPGQAATALVALQSIDEILGVLGSEPVRYLSFRELEERAVQEIDAVLAGLLSGRAGIEAALVARHQARRSRDWSGADRLREALAGAQIEVRDEEDGVSW